MTSLDLRELLLALNAHEVEYLIVGGYAVGVHSEPRATKDLDIFIRADEKNSKAVYRALAAFGAPIADLTPQDFNDSSSSTFQVGMPPHRADLLQSIDGVSFDEAWRSRTEALLDGDIPVHVISREHLIRNKLASARSQDIADVEAIRKAESTAKKLKRSKGDQ